MLVVMQGLEIYPCVKFRLAQSFLCQLHAHTYAIQNVLAEAVFVVFREIRCLTMTMFVKSQSFISLPSFMFVSATVSEICESNQNKKEKENFENGYLAPFPGI